MKKTLHYFLIVGACLFLIGCQQFSDENNEKSTEQEENNDEKKVDEGEGNNMNQMNVFQFENLGKAPETTKKQPLNEVLMIFLVNRLSMSRLGRLLLMLRIMKFIQILLLVYIVLVHMMKKYKLVIHMK